MEGKKFWITIFACILLLASPFILFSSPSMRCYFSQIDKNPKSPDSRKWHLRLAGIYFHTMRYKEAATAYRSFTNRYPTDPERPLSLEREGIALHDEGMKAEAIPVWKQLAREYPDDPRGINAVQWLRSQYNVWDIDQ